MKDFELERANHSATPCAVERKFEGGTRSDENKGENRRGQVQNQTKHDWDGMSDGHDRDTPQMADDDTNDSQALTGGASRGAEHLLHGSVTCHKIDQISSSHQCRYVARWQNHQCVTWSVSRGSVSAGVIMRGGHCLKVWTKKQHVVSLSTAESELYAAVKTKAEVLGWQRTWGYHAG